MHWAQWACMTSLGWPLPPIRSSLSPPGVHDDRGRGEVIDQPRPHRLDPRLAQDVRRGWNPGTKP